MTIQLSVVVWTVINFCLLMLILHKLLFKPILAFMDARREKIESAKNELDDVYNSRMEEQRRQAELREAAHRRAKLEAAAAAEAQKQAAAAELSRAKKEYESKLWEEEAHIRAEGDAIIAELCDKLDQLATAFAHRLSD